MTSPKFPSSWSESERIVKVTWALLILQPFRHFTYVTANSTTLPSLYLRHSSFANPSVASPTWQFIIQPFRRFTYITAHSTTLPSLYLRHSSFSNPSVASPTSHFILQPFFRFSYVTSSSLNSPGEPVLILQPFRHFIYSGSQSKWCKGFLAKGSEFGDQKMNTIIINKSIFNF